MIEKKKRGVKPGTPSKKKGKKYTVKTREFRFWANVCDGERLIRFAFSIGILSRQRFNLMMKGLKKSENTAENKEK